MTSLIDCRACGKPISPNASVCPVCGEPTEHRSDSRAAIGFVIFFCLIMAGAIFAYVMAQNERKKQDKEYRDLVRHLSKVSGEPEEYFMKPTALTSPSPSHKK